MGSAKTSEKKGVLVAVMRISNSCTIRRCGSGGHCAGQVSRCSVRHC